MIGLIMIGNSDDKLTQADWSSFVLDVDRAFDASVHYQGARVHGRWFSLPNEPWQNACWCAEWHDDLAHVVDDLKRKLAAISVVYRQESIAWVVAGAAEFLNARDV